jgi:hypothetical protein
VQEEQGATAAFDRARIMRFTMFNEEYAVSLIFTYNRLGIFSDLLQHKSSYILSEIAPLTTLLVLLSFPPYLPTRRESHHFPLCLASGSNSHICCIYPRDKAFGLLICLSRFLTAFMPAYVRSQIRL